MKSPLNCKSYLFDLDLISKKIYTTLTYSDYANISNLYDLTSSAANTKQCQDRNAMIQFSVFDKDIITADDFWGETYFPLSAVPGIPSLW